MEVGEKSSDVDSHSSLYMLQEKVERLAHVIRSELDGSWVDGGQEFIDLLTSQDNRPDLPMDSEIQAFLSEYTEFDSGSVKGSWARRGRGTRSRSTGSGRGEAKQRKRGGPPPWWGWRNIPHKPEDPPYDSLAKTMNDILHHFGVINRKVEHTYKAEMPDSCERFNTEPTTTPDLSLMGYGPSFAFQQGFPTPPSYTHVAVPIAVTGSDRAPEDDQIQLAVYARSCCVHQPNRRFVYSLLMTERTVQVFQFDRGGVVYSRPVNIHQEAETFVKIILALSTADEGKLGFDTRIQWHGHYRYFCTAVDGGSKYMIYSPFNWGDRILRGKATKCWYTQNQDGEELLLKFAWRTPERGLEWEFLEKIAENPIPGVAEVVCRSQPSEMETVFSLRGGIGFADNGEEDVDNRQYYNFLQPYYGPSLRHAPSILVLLEAFRDIIQAQFELAKRGIVHRDISPGNMLLNNRPDAHAGSRGILIDFDLAAFVDGQGKGPAASMKNGTRAFQSIKVLLEIGCHDHLDDLESSFYSLCWLAYTSESPGVPLRSPLPDFLKRWDADDETSMCSKWCFLSNHVFKHYPQGLGPVIEKLINSLKEFFKRVAEPRTERIRLSLRSKEEIKRDEHVKAVVSKVDAHLEVSPPPTMSPAEEIEVHFKEFLELVDGAIADERSLSSKAKQTLAPAPCQADKDVILTVPSNDVLSAKEGGVKPTPESIHPKRPIERESLSDDSAEAPDRLTKKVKKDIK